MLVVVVSVAIRRLKPNPQREVDGKRHVDALPLHGGDEVEKAFQIFGVHLGEVVALPDAAMHAHHVHAILRQPAGKVVGGGIVHPHDVGTGVHRPEAHGLAGLAVHKLSSLRDDPAVLSGDLFVEEAKVNRGGTKGIGRRFEGKPAIHRQSVFLVRLELAAWHDVARAEQERVEAHCAFILHDLDAQTMRACAQLHLSQRDPVCHYK